MSKRLKKIYSLLHIGIITFGLLISEFDKNSINAMNNATLKMNNEQNINSKKNCNYKVAYITIDDGPSRYTDDIMEILKKYNAKATFFMIDKNMKRYPQQVRNIISEGHTAGLHSVSHDIHALYRNEHSAKDEFDKNKETFYEITNKDSNIIRLPYGSKPYAPTKSYEILIEAGYKLWDWDIDTQDWRCSSDEIVENVKSSIANRNEVVILVHEKSQTVEALEEIIIYLVDEGYQLLSISEGQEPRNFWSRQIIK